MSHRQCDNTISVHALNLNQHGMNSSSRCLLSNSQRS